MKNLILTLILSLPTNIFGQISGVVIDKKTRNPIEYANIWVENQNTGTTSNISGRFQFKENVVGNSLIVSAIGYETSHSLIDSGNSIVELNPMTYEIDEVIVRPKKNKTEVKIDEYSKSKINYFFGCSKFPWIVAKFFNYSSLYESTPYLKKIKILVESRGKASTFNIRLINVGENGEPSTDILKNNLLVEAKKGKRNVIIDISKYNIQFPKQGFFIALEWLIIDSNKNIYEATNTGTNKLESVVRYEPLFGVVKYDKEYDNWTYSNGTWRKSKLTPPIKMEKSGDLAIELTLSN